MLLGRIRRLIPNVGRIASFHRLTGYLARRGLGRGARRTTSGPQRAVRRPREGGFRCAGFSPGSVAELALYAEYGDNFGNAGLSFNR